MTLEPTRQSIRSPLWRETAIGLATFAVYILVAALVTPGRRDVAERNADAVLVFEQWAHIDFEKTLNRGLAPHPVLSVPANYEYAYTYILSALAR